MAYRLDIKRILSMNFFHDLPQIMLGCALAAIATDLFLIPNGLAAGGVTGLATIIQAVGASRGISLPVGIQTIVMNALLLLVVMREGGMFYVVQTATGFVLLGFFTDLFAPFVAPLADADLMLPAMWGGIITGIGYGMVLRAGANGAHVAVEGAAGGSDTIGQIISRNTSLPVGSTVMAIDVAVCALSAPVFSIENALYAGLSMVISGYVIDAVVDGGNKRRMVLIISDKFPDIAADIMYGLGRGCTKFKATGMYSGAEKPVIMVIVSRRELNTLKTIVRERDPHAIVTVADVTEAFGEGFKDISA
jgi:uncharacterized membrane-anchored protein YitT (DUF2179 family)